MQPITPTSGPCARIGAGDPQQRRERDTFQTTLLSLLVWGVGTVLTMILFLVMLIVVIVTYPFDKKRAIAHAQCYWWADLLTGFNPFWKVRVSGLENIDKKRTYVVVANHQSLADIIILYKTKMQFKWVAKKSLFQVPFIGWCLSLARHIALNRGNYSSIKQVYRDAAVWLSRDMSVLFFPEGTRSRTDQMNEFQSGAFKLAIKAKRPILPIVLSGTREAIPRGSWRFHTRVNCSVNVLPPIETAGLVLGDFERLKETTVEKFIAAAPA